MTNKLQIKDVMSKSPLTIGSSQTLHVAKEKMLEHNIRHLPVQQGGMLKGIISERDIHFACAIDQKEDSRIQVMDALTEEPYVVSPTDLVADVSRKMAHEHIGSALVVENGKLVGIFTTVDACSTLAEVLSNRIEQ